MVTQLPSTGHPQDGLRPEGESPQVAGAEPLRTDVPRILTPSNPVAHWLRLPDRDLAIVDTVNKFNQVSSSQLLRLFFSDNSPASREVRLSRTMARLVKKGAVKRIRVGGYIYIPATSTARNAWPHTLEITELYTRLRTSEPTHSGVLAESGIQEWFSVIDFIPEAHRNVGRITLKPDAWFRLRVGERTRQVFAEVDLATENKGRITAKMGAYFLAWESLDKQKVATFPVIVFVCYALNRKADLITWRDLLGKSLQAEKRLEHRETIRTLVRVMTMDELLAYLEA